MSAKKQNQKLIYKQNEFIFTVQLIFFPLYIAAQNSKKYRKKTS